MTKSLFFSVCAVCLIAFAACVKQVGKPVVEKVAPVTAGFCDSIRYAKHIQPIIAGNCSIPTCHVAGGTGLGNFTIFDELKEKVTSGKFKLRVFDSPLNPMPASGMLPQAQLDVIKCWLDKGANND